jgi:hypothetical protein
VPRGGHHLEADLPELELLPVAQRPVTEPDVGARRRQQLDVTSGRDLNEPGQVVVVAVRVERVPNAQPLHPCRGKVTRHVTLGIEHQRLARLLRADEIGGVPETLQVELLEKHGCSTEI